MDFHERDEVRVELNMSVPARMMSVELVAEIKRVFVMAQSRVIVESVVVILPRQRKV